MMLSILVAVGAVVIVSLGIYAGRLMAMLHKQNKQQDSVRQERIRSMVQSIQTIAFAMHQQQCNLSEGAIRIFRLLEALPLATLPDYPAKYPSLFALFEQVKDLPTHDARNNMSKQERRKQDQMREQQESELESRILIEVEELKAFSV